MATNKHRFTRNPPTIKQQMASKHKVVSLDTNYFVFGSIIGMALILGMIFTAQG